MSEPNIYRYINEEQEQLHAAKNNPGVNGCAPFPWHEQPILNKDAAARPGGGRLSCDGRSPRHQNTAAPVKRGAMAYGDMVKSRIAEDR